MIRRVVKKIRKMRQPKKLIVISVVIPLYNAMPYFERTLESLLAQSLNLETVEVIIVDDGSTDGSQWYARKMALRHYGFIKYIRIKRSGSPARPRNVGLQHAQGEYVFFLDADDFLGEEALEKMRNLARRWESDVLVPKQVGENGRKVPVSMFKFNQPDANVWVSRVYYTLSPLKLFRRSLLVENGITFPETMRYREDEIFTSKALYCANKISIASNYDYCHIVSRDDGGNLSTEPQTAYYKNLKVTRMLLSLMEENEPEVGAGDKIVLPRIVKTVWFSAVYAASLEPDPVKGRLFQELLQVLGDRLESDMLKKNLPGGILALIACMQEGDHDGASKCFGVFRMSANGSFAGLNLEAGDLESVGERVMLCVHDSGVRIDVTSSIPIEAQIESMDMSDDGLSITCSCIHDRFWTADSSFELVVRAEGAEPFCSLEMSVASPVEDDDERLLFSTLIPNECLTRITLTSEGSFPVFLTARGEGITREVRLGAHMSEECRKVFPKGTKLIVNGDRILKIHYTPSGSLVFWAKTETVIQNRGNQKTGY